MIDPINRWFAVTKFSNKKAMTIANLVETMCLVRYSYPVEITYDQGGEILGRKFENILIENEYGIKTNPSSTWNPQADAII